MPSDRRKGDIKVLVGATIAVLLLGFFIAGAAIVTTRRLQAASSAGSSPSVSRPTSATTSTVAGPTS